MFINNIINLRPYFFSLREIDTNVSLDIKLPSTWEFGKHIVKYQSIKYKVQDKNDNFSLVSLITDSTFDGYENVFNCAKEIVDINKENEEKQKLLQLKIKELEVLFQLESLEKLREISFIDYGEKQEDTTVVGMVKQGDVEGREGHLESQETND
jgi:hypothetical protein